jgi:hypothetical protein
VSVKKLACLNCLPLISSHVGTIRIKPSDAGRSSAVQIVVKRTEDFPNLDKLGYYSRNKVSKTIIHFLTERCNYKRYR